MKHFFLILTLLEISIAGICQTNKETTGNREQLEQYLWSYSKNSSKPGEKALVDLDVMDKWRGMGGYLSVSNDGKYFAYVINKMAYYNVGFGLSKLDSLVIQSTKNGRRTVFAGVRTGFFTADSRQYIFQNKETLCFLQLEGMQLKKIENIISYRVSQDKWLAYQVKGKDSLMLRNLATGKEKSFAGITGYDFKNEWLICQRSNKELLLLNKDAGTEKYFSSVDAYLFAENSKALLIKSIDKGLATLQWVSLPQGDAKTIWTAKEKTSIGNYKIDVSGRQVVFSIADSTNTDNTAIGYYEQGMDKGVLKITNQIPGIPIGLIINGASFTDNGRYLIISMQSKTKEAEKPNAELAGLEIWNHKDLYLQSAQSRLNDAESFNAIVNIEKGRLIFMESDDKKIEQMHGDFALIKNDNTKDLGDRFWEPAKDDSLWIVSLKEGNSRFLNTGEERYWFSPSSNYLLYFDNSRGCHYYSCDLNTGAVNDISVNVPENRLGIINRENDQRPKSGSVAAWVENEANVLVYDNYDIWRLDLTGKQPAINITDGVGLSKSIILNLFSTDRGSYEIPTLKPVEPLLLRGYNISTRQISFYKKDGIKSGTPTELYTGNYYMNEIGGCQDGNVLTNRGMAPAKAKTANSWIVQRQSSNDAPNFYETSDFKNFRRLTDFQPQKAYQWFTEEIISFKYLDGKTGQGILYKPENFDPNKKYPVLIPFYGGFSGNMHQFPLPSFIDQAMETGKSPVWFLNNGYLVFTPDIAVTSGKFGPKAFSVIEGAAQYLKALPYVDGNKLGIASHSWGAKLAAYIFNHSTSIAATAISEGLWYGNMINVALSTEDNGQSKLGGAETGEYGFGNLWENKESWLDQTTVLNVDKSISSLLLFCNKESVPEYQNQTIQLFTALRRLDKNVWWLKYDNGEHTLHDLKELKDYTVRYTQFFDHYLKNAPAPQWMTEGIPLELKGIESRYGLDPKGQCNDSNGEPCPICQAWNKQYKRTPTMFRKEIKDWVLDKDIADELERKQNEKRKALDREGEVRTREVMRMLEK